MSTDKKISVLIPEQVPDFVRTDHPKFIDFLKAYYEFTEQDGGAVEQGKNLLPNFDIDKTNLDVFYESFRKQFLPNFPRQTLANKALILKNVREFYRAKGSEKSFKFLLGVAYGIEPTFYYPSRDLFRLSDGKWIQLYSLKLNAVTGNPMNLAGQKIRGETSGASGFVESVLLFHLGLFFVYEVYLNRSSITGNFIANETITIEDESITATTFSVISELEFSDRGEGYVVGDKILFTGGDGIGGFAKVKQVGDNGEILKVQISDSGVAYDIAPTPVFTGGTSTAVATVNTDAETIYPGYYLNDDSQLSSTKRLQDSYFWQDLSYVVRVEETMNIYKKLLLDVLHPAGLKLFGEFLTIQYIDASVNLAVSPNATSKLTMYSSITETPELQAYQETLIIVSKPGLNSVPVGASMRSIHRDRFKANPTENNPNAPFEMIGPNSGYWDEFANLQLKDIADITLDDLINNPNKRTNVQPDPTLKNT